jgi:hypothetical protein
MCEQQTFRRCLDPPGSGAGNRTVRKIDAAAILFFGDLLNIFSCLSVVGVERFEIENGIEKQRQFSIFVTP